MTATFNDAEWDEPMEADAIAIADHAVQIARERDEALLELAHYREVMPKLVEALQQIAAFSHWEGESHVS